ncbi:cupin domain-containing protein [Priestia megaterium]|uniref:cupin domain-containing protein n=1 Tax=Priestia megaterium TaxID=1404 RepID=UPI002A698E67|nr:cupin domain-containing protein [Priestia megaterium]MDY0944259.1 cupin domain-containing protein [Priestia megaterium]
MKIYKLNKENGKKVEKYDSNLATYLKLVQTNEIANIGCMYIDPKGILGYHQAPVSQLFVVVQGEGWVTGEDQKQINIKAGEAAFWEKGEWHTSGSNSGMTAILIQSESLNPQSFMKIK